MRANPDGLAVRKTAELFGRQRDVGPLQIEPAAGDFALATGLLGLLTVGSIIHEFMGRVA